METASGVAEFIFVDGPVELPLQHGEKVNTRGWAEDGRELDVERVQKVLAAAWAEQGPFDGVMGFSEGASVAALYASWAVARDLSRSDHATFQGLRFAILAGAPAPMSAFAEVSLPSLHFGSPHDSVVPLTDSRRLAACFQGSEFYEHAGGHSMPQHAEDIRHLVDFLGRIRSEVLLEVSGQNLPIFGEESEDARISQDQRDELEGLMSMYEPSEIVRIPPLWPVRLAARVDGTKEAWLRFTLPPAYPETAQCHYDFMTNEMHLLAHQTELVAAVEEARGPLGMFSVMPMVQAARMWVESSDNLADGSPALLSSDADYETVCNEWWLKEEDAIDEEVRKKAEHRAAELIPDTSNSVATAWAREYGAGRYERPWEFVVGLVGKPSAGKSTFFNAATRPERPEREACMSPHPFTTIDPNVGGGWFAAPCASRRPGFADNADPEHGKLPGNRRRHPLLVKDVAGLVPGAYLGRGRGNAFLNDLCDADSLIHVVDASGRSDREGVDQGGSAQASDPLDEVGWVRREIHLWIFCNLRAKWDTVRRKTKLMDNPQTRELLADRLFGLFNGYRASRQMVCHVYEAAGFSLRGMYEAIPSWSEYDLHLFVACFLRVRFPIVVALNKMDLPQAAERTEQVMAVLGDAVVPVSARAEWWLWEQQRKGHLTYVEGAGMESIVPSTTAPENNADQLKQLKSKILDVYGSTGVMEALTRAVLRRRPIFACPVKDFDSCEGLVAVDSQMQGKPSVFGTMVMLRPLSTVEEAFSALRHEKMLRGDFVRAEILEEKSGKVCPLPRVLKRDEILAAGDRCHAVVLKMLTNKKAYWQT